MGAMNNTYEVLVGKQLGERPLKRYRCKWKDNIKMDLRETEWRDMDWIHLPQNREQWRALVNMAMNLRLNKILGNIRIAERLAVSQGLGSMKSVIGQI
jgi:hypothetical protein